MMRLVFAYNSTYSLFTSTEQELEVLKAEFSHHIQKIAEYEQLKKDINRIEGRSPVMLKK